MYGFEENKEYSFKYRTNATLWINDISDEAKSTLQLETTAKVGLTGKCTYVLRLSNSILSGVTLDSTDLSPLDSFAVVFRMNNEGQIEQNVLFEQKDQNWSKNVKRAIISAFQTKSTENLREIEEGKKSAVFYETDVLGKCRTTYALKQGFLRKTKSLHTCTLDTQKKSSSLHFVPYLNTPVWLFLFKDL